MSEYLELASQLEPQVFQSKKTMDLTAHYRAVLSSRRLEDCLLLIKEISTKQKDLSSHGKKLGSVDEQYLKLAERLVCEEFAAVLHTTPDAVKKHLHAAMRRRVSGRNRRLCRRLLFNTTMLRQRTLKQLSASFIAIYESPSSGNHPEWREAVSVSRVRQV